MTRIDEMLRSELGKRPRPVLSPFFVRRTVSRLRSAQEPRRLAGLIVPLLVVPPSLWILATSLPPFWTLLSLPVALAITVMANPVRS